MNDSIKLAELAGKHFRKRFKEEFGEDAFIDDVMIVGNIVSMKLSIPNEWEPMTKDIMRNLTHEIYEILNQGLA